MASSLSHFMGTEEWGLGTGYWVLGSVLDVG
jgi:hypothetical protein